jgi:hypothetical protein
MFEFPEGGIRKLSNRGRISKVTHHGNAVRSYLSGSTLELLLIAPGDNNLCTLMDKSSGNRSSNAATAAGNNGNFVGQTHAWDCIEQIGD